MFTPQDLDNFRAAQEAHLPDTYVRQVYSRTFNSFGEPVASYADAAPAACGLDMRPGSERHQTLNTLLEYDATLRLAVGTTIDPKDRIKITARFGETLATALVYEILSPVQLGPSGIRLLLRRIEV